MNRWVSGINVSQTRCFSAAPGRLYCLDQFCWAFRPWSWSWSGSMVSRTLAWLDCDKVIQSWIDLTAGSEPDHDMHYGLQAAFLLMQVSHRTQTEPKDRDVVLQKCCAQDIWTIWLKKSKTKKLDANHISTLFIIYVATVLCPLFSEDYNFSTHAQVYWSLSCIAWFV